MRNDSTFIIDQFDFDISQMLDVFAPSKAIFDKRNPFLLDFFFGFYDMQIVVVELMKLLLEKFDIQDPQTFLPDVSQLQQQQAQQGQGVPQGTVSPLGGFFGPGPLAQGQNQLSSLLGI